MPAVETRGFQVAERPGIQYLPPASFTPQLSALLPAVGQGLGLYGSLQGIADEAQARPIRQQLQEIQLQEAQAKLASLPVERQLQQIRLNTLGQPIERIEGVAVTEAPRNPLQPMLDENGVVMLDANGNPRMERVAGPVDLLETNTGTSFNPVTNQRTSFERPAKILRTAEQVANDAALADYRTDLGDAAVRRAQIIASKIANGKKISQGVNPTTGTLVVTLQNPDGSIEQVDTGQTPVLSAMDKVLQKLDIGTPAAPGLPNIAVPGKNTFQLNIPGARTMSPAVAAADTVAEEVAPVLDDALVTQLTQAFEAPASAPANSAANPAHPTSKAEYDALPSRSYYVAPDGNVKQKK